jgi:mRNA interferase MazF
MLQEVKRGEIYWVDWNPGRGSEQTGTRPAVIIQNDIGNRSSPTTIIACCTTAEIRSYPFVVTITGKESGLPKDCAINLSAILTIAKSRLGVKCGQLNMGKMLEVDTAIRFSLGLDERFR